MNSPRRWAACPLALGVLWSLASCDGGVVHPVATPPLVNDAVPAGFPAGTPTSLAPVDNALTEDRARLGRRLFFDTQLSRTGQVACASCHLSQRAFSDPNIVSTGVDQHQGTRNAPALVNLAWGQKFFWDGRVASLEEQAGKPIENPDEMDLPLSQAAARVGKDAAFSQAFLDSYGGPATEELLRKAIASFVRTLVSANSPYDRHLRGDDAAFDAAAGRGEAIFLSDQGGCFHCHPAGTLTNDGFFNNGAYREGGDVGRQAVTTRTGDRGKFRVPGLRNVAVSAPYMHDGSLATLEDVVDFYDRGGNGDATTDPTIRKLSLTAGQKADLLAFLRSLTDPDFLADPRWAPPLP